MARTDPAWFAAADPVKGMGAEVVGPTGTAVGEPPGAEVTNVVPLEGPTGLPLGLAPLVERGTVVGATTVFELLDEQVVVMVVVNSVIVVNTPEPDELMTGMLVGADEEVVTGVLVGAAEEVEAEEVALVLTLAEALEVALSVFDCEALVDAVLDDDVIGNCGIQPGSRKEPLIFPDPPTTRQFFSQAATPGDWVKQEAKPTPSGG